MKKHITVLAQEAVEALAIKKTSTVVDATFGAGGHASLIARKLGNKGTLLAVDADPDAMQKGKEILKDAKCKTHFATGNYRNINTICEELKLGKADAILADLGWRMEQFSGNGRGFSFQIDEPLVMTFGNPNEYAFVARDILNDWRETDIRNILKGYGEERFAGRIASKIAEAREKSPIETTFDLVRIIKAAVPPKYQYGKIHPATRTFQALRITVNDEFDALETFIKKAITLLNPKGRLAIITFHSIEDRIVKHLFKNLASDQVGRMVTKKPIVPAEEELKANPRARSAKLRVFEKYEEA
jgi:16S rRNA (cytosine1402-N4)-methyltransferase